MMILNKNIYLFQNRSGDEGGYGGISVHDGISRFYLGSTTAERKKNILVVVFYFVRTVVVVQTEC